MTADTCAGYWVSIVSQTVNKPLMDPQQLLWGAISGSFNHYEGGATNCACQQTRAPTLSPICIENWRNWFLEIGRGLDEGLLERYLMPFLTLIPFYWFYWCVIFCVGLGEFWGDYNDPDPRAPLRCSQRCDKHLRPTPNHPATINSLLLQWVCVNDVANFAHLPLSDKVTKPYVMYVKHIE